MNVFSSLFSQARVLDRKLKMVSYIFETPGLYEIYILRSYTVTQVQIRTPNIY